MHTSINPHNVLLGKLEDGTSCALVAAHDLDTLEAQMAQEAGRTLYPGELYSAAARQLSVKRILTIRCPQGASLTSLLASAGPGQVKALVPLSSDTREDLEISGLSLTD